MRRIYIGNLSSRATKRDIAKFFHRYGPLEDILLRDGFGFVQLSSSTDAEDAVDYLNGRDLCGSRVSLEMARSERRGGRDRYGPPTRTRHRLVVKNLGSDVKWQDLKDLVRRAGEVTFADVHRPVRGEGIVEFESRDDMRRALKQSRSPINNNDKAKARSASRSKSKSRSPSRSRSNSPGSRRSRSGSPGARRDNNGAAAERRSRSRSDSRGSR
uniref:RRM domain-containing protein n=1 Tax=Macrostomum lignano TaxID=282301 RepID=A0A1I8G929_9PLAT